MSLSGQTSEWEEIAVYSFLKERARPATVGNIAQNLPRVSSNMEWIRAACNRLQQQGRINQDDKGNFTIVEKEKPNAKAD